jgi:hypothetical protein
MTLRVEGAQNFRELARDLRAAGSDGKILSKELFRGFWEATTPMREAAIKGAERLPRSGGQPSPRKTLRKVGTKTVLGQEYVVRRDIWSKKKYDNESLSSRVQQATFRVRGRQGQNPAVFLTASPKGKKSASLGALDAGHNRHPVWARGPRGTWHWVAQEVPEGWFTESIETDALDDVQKKVIEAIERVMEMLAAGGMR